MDYLSSVGIVAAVTFFPVLLGTTIGGLAGSLSGKRYLFSALAAGISSWLFVDLMADSAFLDVNMGFGGGLGQLALILLFVLGFATLAMGDEGFGRSSTPTLVTASLAATAIGLHSLGEGMVVASALAGRTGELLSESGAIAFILHKALEGLVLGTFLQSKSFMRDATLLASLVGAFAIFGAPLGYNSLLDSSYFFSLGAGGVLFIIWRTIPQALSGASSKAAVVMALLGTLSVYASALLHS